jgi:hypothetical protein
VYLDTALWYDLADRRITAPNFEDAVRRGDIKPVLSFIHLMELAQSEPSSRNRVTQYIDALNEGGRVIWIKTLPVIAEEELKHAFLEYQLIPPGQFNVFSAAFVDTLRTRIPGLDRDEARTYDMTRLVSIMHDLRSFRRHQLFRRSRALWDIVRLQFQRAREGNSSDPWESEYIQNIWADIPRRVQSPAGLFIDITPSVRHEFLRQLRWEELPAIALRVALMNGWSLGSGGARPSDFEDLFHIAPPIAYCDVTFADRRVYAALERGGAWRFPMRNSEFRDWCSTL